MTLLPQKYRAKNPGINPFDPAMGPYMWFEHMRMQQSLYMKEMHIAQVQKELKQKMHEEKRLQEIMQLCDLKDEAVYEKAQKTACLVGDQPKGETKNYDKNNPEADGLLHDLHNQEYEMAKILAKLDEKSESYRVKLRKLKELVKFRKELERMLHFKVTQNHYDYEKIKEERKRKDFFVKKLRK